MAKINKETPAERVARWRVEKPEKYAAARLKSQASRKLRWAAFLASERLRYIEKREAKLAAQKAARELDPDKFRARVRQSYNRDPSAAIANLAKRRARKLSATPAWSEKAAIRAVYAEARRLTKTTGILHEVDHIYPLKGRDSCGLHVLANLQIITRDANRRKFTSVELPA